jgi:hypothetical protein
MRSIFKLLLPGLLLALPAFAKAQTATVFPDDEIAFQQIFTAFMTDADKKQGNAFITEVFAPLWNGAYLSPSQHSRLISALQCDVQKAVQANSGFHGPVHHGRRIPQGIACPR